MQRIQGATAQNEKFTEGDPSTATPATVVSATWLNGVQEELIRLLTMSGIAPSEADNTQVFQALERLYGGGVEILTLLTSTAVSGVVTAALGARTRPVVIVVAGGSSLMTLHVTGSIPEGCEVPVVNWTNGPLTVTSDSDVIGSGNVVPMQGVGRLLQGTSQWFLQISPSASSVASSIATAVSGESQARIAGDQALQSQLNSEAQTRALADSTESQVREAADQTLTTNLAAETQRAQSAEQGIASQVSTQGGYIDGLTTALNGRDVTFQDGGSGYSISFQNFAESYGSKAATAFRGKLKKLSGSDGWSLFLYIKSPTRNSGAVGGMQIDLELPNTTLWQEFAAALDAARSAKLYHVGKMLELSTAIGVSEDNSMAAISLGVSSISGTGFSLFPVDWKGSSVQVDAFVPVGAWGEIRMELRIPAGV